MYFPFTVVKGKHIKITYFTVSQCGNSSCCFCNLTWTFKKRRFGRWYWVRVTAGGEWPACACFTWQPAEYMHIAFTVDVQFNTVPWSPSRSSWHRVPWFAEQLPKNPISNMLHSVKSFAGWSNGWDINSQAGKKLEVFDPSTVVSLHFFVVGITAWLPTNTEMQILWSNNVMQTRLCGLHLVCAA